MNQDKALYRWVKASERLPEKDGLYIIKDSEQKNIKIDEMYYCDKSPTKWHYINPQRQKTNNVIVNRNYIVEWLEKVEADQQEVERVVTEILKDTWTTSGVLDKLQKHFIIIPKQ